MSLSMVRAGVRSLGGATRCSFLTPTTTLRPLAVAGIMSKTMRPKDYKRPEPFPYKTNPMYGLWQYLIDKTMHRFDENSKIIVVDGPIAVGKTKFAKEVAEELDMLYVPEANMDMKYINSYGVDLRQLDPQLPLSCRSFDERNFLQDPTHINVTGFQFHKFGLRLAQYIDAIAHVLSTGQGVVMDRSVYSDFVFVEAMVKFGYMSKQASDYYYKCVQQTVPELMRPHLVIYLDCPVDVVMKRVKARGHPHEVTSPAINPQYLAYMEMVYKQKFLKQISTHAELLIYDWSEEGDIEVVVEDVERLHFILDKHDPKMADWKINNDEDWGDKRMLYTKGKERILRWMVVPDFTIPEMLISAEDYKVFEEVWRDAPGNKYVPGFNADMGDHSIATKYKIASAT